MNGPNGGQPRSRQPLAPAPAPAPGAQGQVAAELTLGGSPYPPIASNALLSESA